jgi:hypothetical protein
MKRHRTLLVAAILLFVAAWFAWNVLLVESDTELPMQAESR